MASSAFSKMDWSSHSVVLRPGDLAFSFCAQNGIARSSTTVANAARRPRSRTAAVQPASGTKGQRNEETATSLR